MKLLIAIFTTLLTVSTPGAAQICNINRVDSSGGPCSAFASGHYVGTPGNEYACHTDFMCIDSVLGYACMQGRTVWQRMWWVCNNWELQGETETSAQNYAPGGNGLAHAYSNDFSIYEIESNQVNCNGSTSGNQILGFYCP